MIINIHYNIVHISHNMMRCTSDKVDFYLSMFGIGDFFLSVVIFDFVVLEQRLETVQRKLHEMNFTEQKEKFLKFKLFHCLFMLVFISSEKFLIAQNSILCAFGFFGSCIQTDIYFHLKTLCIVIVYGAMSKIGREFSCYSLIFVWLFCIFKPSPTRIEFSPFFSLAYGCHFEFKNGRLYRNRKINLQAPIK